MVFLTRHEESIKARLCFAFLNKSKFNLSFLSIQYNPLQALNLFELLLLLCTKSFLKFSDFPNLENLCYSSFHSLLPLPKRIRQGLTAWILFVSLFSLFQKNKGLTAWILLCLPSPCQRIQNDTVWEFFRFFPFPNTKVFKGLTAWEFFCIPIHKVSKV